MNTFNKVLLFAVCAFFGVKAGTNDTATTASATTAPVKEVVNAYVWDEAAKKAAEDKKTNTLKDIEGKLAANKATKEQVEAAEKALAEAKTDEAKKEAQTKLDNLKKDLAAKNDLEAEKAALGKTEYAIASGVVAVTSLYASDAFNTLVENKKLALAFVAVAAVAGVVGYVAAASQVDDVDLD